jgi:hypothetical protein
MKSFFTKTFAIIILATTITVTQAQSLQLGIKGEPIENNTEWYFFGTPYSPEFLPTNLKLNLLLTNKTNNSITVEGHFAVVQEPAGTSAEWCIFGNCWPTPFLPPTSMPANFTEGLDDMFYLQTRMNENFEPATYTIHLNVLGSPSDNVFTTIHFINREYMSEELIEEFGYLENDTVIFKGYITSNKPVIARMPTVKVYPNPATDHINFEMGDERGTITVFNAMGNVVRRVRATSNVVTVDLSGLAAGMYFYAIENAGRKTTGAFFVK